jgi:hypothetical protein
MRPKYEKPIFTELGDALPNVAGTCTLGSGPQTYQSCTLGSGYAGGDCQKGTTAGLLCKQGSVASNTSP